jgi:hypothetical protein
VDLVALRVVPPLRVYGVRPFNGMPLMPILIYGSYFTRLLFASIRRPRKQFLLPHHDRQVPAGTCCCSIQASPRFFGQEVHDRTHSLAGERPVKMALFRLRETASKAEVASWGMPNHKDFWAGLSIWAVPVRFTDGGSHEVYFAHLRRRERVG